MLINFFSAACAFRALGSTSAPITVYATGPPLGAASTATKAIVRTFATAAAASSGCELSRSSADRGATAAGATMPGMSLAKSQPVRGLAASIAAPVVRDASTTAVVWDDLCACRLSCATNNDGDDLPGLYRDDAVCESLRTKHSGVSVLSSRERLRTPWRPVQRGVGRAHPAATRRVCRRSVCDASTPSRSPQLHIDHRHPRRHDERLVGACVEESAGLAGRESQQRARQRTPQHGAQML